MSINRIRYNMGYHKLQHVLSVQLCNAFRRRRSRSTTYFELTYYFSTMHSHEMHSRTRCVPVLSSLAGYTARGTKCKIIKIIIIIVAGNIIMM